MPRRKSKFKYILFLIIPAILAVLWVKIDYEASKNTPADINNKETISFFIEKGESAKKIAANLEEAGLINKQKYFYWYLRLNNKIPDILAGRFMLSPSMNYQEIGENISNPQMAEFVITVQEGLRIRDIDKKLVDMELIEEGAFVSATKTFSDKENYPFLHIALLSKAELPLEGYLFPDTYFIDPVDFKSENLIRKMLNNFKSKVGQDMIRKIDERKITMHDAIIMASILEKEVRTNKDLPLVSGILWKRLQTAGWTLGADATLLYEKDDNKITSADLNSNSPYNTRKFGGLPPGAISNPGLESIKAAISPTDSPYWFYLTTPDTGEVIYAKTNEEHNINRAKHL